MANNLNVGAGKPALTGEGLSDNVIALRPEQPQEQPTKSKAPKRLKSSSFPDGPVGDAKHLPTTIDNVEHMLKEAEIIPRYNEIKKKVEIAIPGHQGTPDNFDNATLAMILSLANNNGLSTGLIPAFVDAIADRNAYNPVADWIRSQPWDMENRLPAFYETVTEANGYPDHLKDLLLRKWLLSATAAALMPTGFKARGVLTLQGPQGIGKTSWCMALVSDAELRNMVVKVDHHLDGTNKDSILGAVTHWLCEIGELDSSLKKDVARLKGFLTNNYDKVRRPYAKADSEYPRRTVFIATVNDRNFLVDPTGNTRFWTISVKALNFKHEIDMQQLFAQMAVNMEHGAEWWLTPDEERVLEDYNRQHRNVSLVSDVVLKHMDLDYKGAANLAAMTPMELLKEAGIDHPNNAQCKECAGLLREVLGDSKRIKGRDVWRIPVKPSDSKFAKMMPANTIDEDDDDRY